MKKVVMGLLVTLMCLQTSAAFAFGFDCLGCCGRPKVGCRSDFNGLYIGGNLGVGTHNAFRQDFDGRLGTPSGWASVDTACTGGAQIGYDRTCNNVLFGVVWDFNGLATDRKINLTPFVNQTLYAHNKSIWFTTVRGRAGITVCDALFYLTGGLAVARTETTWSNAANSIGFKGNRVGWTAGFGAEYIACENWSLGTDILMLQFDDKEKTFRFGANSFSFAQADRLWAWRFLLNYRFEELCCW